MFRQIQEAYEIIGNETNRKHYDYQYNNSQNLELKISYFSSDKQSFSNDELITFNWKVMNADKITIQPFGIVEAMGEKTFKLKKCERKFITIELIATNSLINKTISQKITLENITFKRLKPKITKQENSKSKYDTLLEYLVYIFVIGSPIIVLVILRFL